MTLGEILKHARKALEKTLGEVSKDLKIPISSINSWERNASYPRGARRDKVEAYYKLPKGTLDYANINEATGAKEFNVQQATQDAAMSDYETKAIMLHKGNWERAEKLRNDAGDLDFNELFARLIKAESK